MPSKAISELVYLVVCRGIVGKICHHALWSPHPHNHSAAISESRFLCKKKNGCFVLFSVCLYICVCECLLHDNITGVPSRFAQYCASTCVRFGCTRHAISICVDCKPKKNQHDSRSNMARYLRLFQITFFLSDYLVNRVEKKIARIFQKKIVVMDAFVVWNPQTHP